MLPLGRAGASPAAREVRMALSERSIEHEDRWLTLPEAARMTGVSLDTWPARHANTRAVMCDSAAVPQACGRVPLTPAGIALADLPSARGNCQMSKCWRDSGGLVISAIWRTF